MQNLISVIIPCYNAEKTIEKPIKSLLEQSYKNLEIIIVNDGCVDNTLKIIKKYALNDARIKVINQENAGVSIARNNGLQNSTGEYIMFLDADDNYTTPFAIENMLQALKRNNADMCICNFTHPCFELHTKGDRVFKLSETKDFFNFYQDFFLYAMPWNKLIKRDCLTEWFVKGITFNEDELFNLDNLHNMQRVVFIDKVFYNYYCSTQPTSAVNSIYSMPNFWKQKSTIWHMGMKNHNYRTNSITNFFPHYKQDMQFVRSFDFILWDFFLMAKNGVKTDNVFYTMQTIFHNELFIETLKHKELYGLQLRDITDKRILQFTKLAYNAFTDIKQSNKKISINLVFLSLFGEIFYQLGEQVNSQDLLVQTMLDYKQLKTAEAWYVKAILE